MFGVRLRVSRENKRLTQQEMGDLLGITAVGYSKYEKETSDPSLSNLKKICEKLEVSADWLLGVEVNREISTYKDFTQILLDFKKKIPVTGEFLFGFKEGKYVLEISAEGLVTFFKSFNVFDRLWTTGQITTEQYNQWLNGALQDLDKPLYLPFDDEQTDDNAEDPD